MAQPIRTISYFRYKNEDETIKIQNNGTEISTTTTTLNFVGTTLGLTPDGTVLTITDSGSGVSNIATGTGLTGGPITGTGTISLANTAVAAGTYGLYNQWPTIVVDPQGRITSATNFLKPTFCAECNLVGATLDGSNRVPFSGLGGTIISNDASSFVDPGSNFYRFYPTFTGNYTVTVTFFKTDATSCGVSLYAGGVLVSPLIAQQTTGAGYTLTHTNALGSGPGGELEIRLAGTQPVAVGRVQISVCWV